MKQRIKIIIRGGDDDRAKILEDLRWRPKQIKSEIREDRWNDIHDQKSEHTDVVLLFL